MSEIAFENWRIFQLPRARDLDLGSGHTAYHRASLIDLYVHAKFHWNRRNFLWTDGRAFETHFIRSIQNQKSRPDNKWSKNFDERPHCRLVTPRGGEWIRIRPSSPPHLIPYMLPWAVGPACVSHPNGISISSAVFRTAHERDQTTDSV